MKTWPRKNDWKNESWSWSSQIIANWRTWTWEGESTATIKGLKTNASFQKEGGWNGVPATINGVDG